MRAELWAEREYRHGHREVLGAMARRQVGAMAPGVAPAVQKSDRERLPEVTVRMVERSRGGATTTEPGSCSRSDDDEKATDDA